MHDLAILRVSGPLPLLSVSAGTALCAASAAPFWPGHMEWAPRLADGMVAGAAVILASLLAVMMRMTVLDWLTEKQSHRAWTAIGAGADEPAVNRPDQSDHPYVPVASDPEVRAILRAHRRAIPLAAAGRESEAGSADAGVDLLPCAPLGDLLPHAASAAGSNVAHDKSGEAAATLAVIAPAVVGSKVQRRRRVGFAMDARRVVNAGWASLRGLRVLGIPVRIASDIVIVGQGEKEPPPGEPPHQQLNGSTTRPFTAVAEARRQVVALAEALARQAAREDDAAEAAQERSRLPPDASAEQSPPHGAKDDDTS